MATALYRRYRSLRFGDLIGQDVIATTLRNEVRAGTLAHAYLFTGIRGTGKTSTARILARAVNCLDLQDGEPCNRCSACVEITDGSSVDVLEIDAASNRGIDEMRDLREKVKYLPAALRRKVYIIDEAHMLTTEAWNAFLKTLEEPPPHVLFVLATTEPHKVPETVRSRVQRFDFRRVSAADINTHLARILEAEGAEAQPEALTLLARAGQGSVRDALSLLDQALAGGDRPLTADNVRRALGVGDPAALHALLHALAGGDGGGALRAIAAAFDSGADPRQLLREASRLCRAAEFAALDHLAGADVAGDEAELAVVLARVAPAGFWLRALELLQAAELELRQPVDARLQVEFCVMRLVTETTLADAQLAALEARVAHLEGGSSPPSPGSVTGTPTPVPGPAPQRPAADRPAAPPAPDRPAAAPPPDRLAATPVPPATPPREPAPTTISQGAEPTRLSAAGDASPAFADAQSWQHHWTALLDAVNRRDRALAGVLRDCRPVAADDGSLTVGAPYNFHLEKLNDRTRLALLTEAVGEVAGSPRVVDVKYVGEGTAPPKRPGGTGEATQAVLDTFAGSRVTSTRLRDDADRPSRGGAA
ncbi:MAG TPA: DNA polymerase III subunit gamma/tau [Candidatus Dormibacteraeota bacterium]|nr:DNA polymerase III subunit gamma/tau [Candidatus Dormibacteraeota bacterium]